MNKDEIISEFKKLGIKIELSTLPDESWISILDTLKKLYEKYPEVPKGVLSTIRAIEPKYKFLYSIGFDFDERTNSYASASGLVLELSKVRFSNPKYIKEETNKQNFMLDVNKVIPYMISQAFSYVLFINAGFLSGKLDTKRIEKTDYDLFTSAEESANIIKENARRRMLDEDEEDIGDISAMRLLADAVADDLAGTGKEVTRHILREYKNYIESIRKRP